MDISRKLLILFAVSASFLYEINADCDMYGGFRCLRSMKIYNCTRRYGCATRHGCLAEQLELPPMPVCRQIERCSHSSLVAATSCFRTSTEKCSDLRSCYRRAGCSALSDWVLGRYCPSGAITYCSYGRAFRTGECIGTAIRHDSACSVYRQCVAHENCERIYASLEPLFPQRCQSKGFGVTTTITTTTTTTTTMTTTTAASSGPVTRGDCDLIAAAECIESQTTFDCDHLHRCATNHGCSAENMQLPPMSVCLDVERCPSSSRVAALSCYQKSTEECSDLRACYGRAGCRAYSDWALGKFCPSGASTYCSNSRAKRAGECIGRALLGHSKCSVFQHCLAQENCEVIRESVAPLLPQECQSSASVKSTSIMVMGTALIMLFIFGM